MDRFKYFITTILAGLFLLPSCGDDDKKGGNNGPTGLVDLDNFSNNVDAAGFHEKAASADKIFDGVDTKIKTLNSSQYASNLMHALTNTLIPGQGQVTEDNFDITDCKLNRNDFKLEQNSQGDWVQTYNCPIENDNESSIICSVVEITKTDGESTIEVSCDDGSSFTIESDDIDTSESDDTDLGSIQLETKIATALTSGLTSCEDGFKLIKSLYATSKEELESDLEVLKDKSKFGSAEFFGAVELKEVEDSDAAIAYTFSPVEKYADSDAITVQGKISAGANEDKILINKEISFNIDLSKFEASSTSMSDDPQTTSGLSNIKMSQHMKIKQAVDLTNKIIDYIEEANFTMTRESQRFSATRVNTISVVGSDTPSVIFNSKVATTGNMGDDEDGTNINASLTVSINLVDDNTLEIKGSSTGIEDATGSHQMRIKNTNGTCSVEEF
ncbi:MAG: hypothetical protein R3B45_02310 [Bdellovibrionota bacterium]